MLIKERGKVRRSDSGTVDRMKRHEKSQAFCERSASSRSRLVRASPSICSLK